MKTFKIKRILVPIDFSECATEALEHALAFADQFHASIILLHVVEPAMAPDLYLSLSPAMTDTNENLLQAGRERLENLCRKRMASRGPAESLVRMGRAHSEIPDTARALGVDLIIMGTHGHSGIKHVLLGSTAERVVRQASCPVMTVRQHEPNNGQAH